MPAESCNLPTTDAWVDPIASQARRQSPNPACPRAPTPATHLKPFAGRCRRSIALPPLKDPCARAPNVLSPGPSMTKVSCESANHSHDAFVMQRHSYVSIWSLYDLADRRTGAALATCLQESDCVMVQRNKPSDCLRYPLNEQLPTRCQQLKRGYGDCKRGWIDMRKRFRGNQPMAVSKEREGEKGGHLYAGGKIISDAGLTGTDKADTDLVEGLDGEKRAKR